MNEVLKNARDELADEVRRLRIELCELQTTLCELRVATANAKIVDLPPWPKPRAGMN